MPASKNLGDVYYEREHTEWYWRALGTLSASLVLLGFLIFPKAFPSADKDPQTLVPLSIVAVVFLALGYSLSVALWFMCRSWLFQLDVLFVPCLCSCVLGAINIGINIAIPASPLGMDWSTAPISAISLAVASTLIYAILCVVTNVKIRRARNLGGPSPAGEEKGEIDPEDSQRKAWAQLLSPGRSYNNYRYDTSTYRIDIPDKARLASKSDLDASRSNSDWTLTEHSPQSATLNASPNAEWHQQTPPPNPYLLNPNVAALQEARERALERSYSTNLKADLKTKVPTVRELPSSEARTPETPEADKTTFNQGAVYRPASGTVQTPGYEVVTIANYTQTESPQNYTPPEELEARMSPQRRWV